MKLKLFILLYICSLVSNHLFAQANFGDRTPITLNIIKDFGANPNDNKDDTWAFILASKYINNLWDKAGRPYTKQEIESNQPLNINYKNNYIRLEIPASNSNKNSYLVGKQEILWKKKIGGKDFSYKDNVSAKTPTQNLLKYQDIFDNVPPENDEGILVRITYKTNPVSAGVYSWSSPYAAHTKIFEILNPSWNTKNKVDGIQIIGISKNGVQPRLKYPDGLMIGCATADGRVPLNNEMTNSFLFDNTNMFRFDKVKNIAIENLEIDGNIQNAFYKGTLSDGYQAGHSGIELHPAKNVTLENLNIHHMGVDGIMIKDFDSIANNRFVYKYLKVDTTVYAAQLHLALLTPTNVVANNVRCDYNRRLGLAWIQGENITFRNSSFSYTGKVISEAEPGKQLNTSPGAGMDIEPDSYGQICRKGTFYNCAFIENSWYNIESNRGDIATNPKCVNPSSYVKNMVFDTCTFWNNNSSGLAITGDSIYFNNCNIWNTINTLSYGNSEDARTVFNNCKFEDKKYLGKHWLDKDKVTQVNNYKSRLIQVPEFFFKRVLFEGCTFKVNDTCREVFYFMGKYGIRENEFNVIKNCAFIYNNGGGPYYYDAAFKPIATRYTSRASGFVFKGKNSIKNIKNSPNSFHSFELMGCIFEGSSNFKEPNSLNVKGQAELFLTSYYPYPKMTTFGRNNTDTNKTDGYFKLIIDSSVLFNASVNKEIHFGENTDIRILPYGTFESYGPVRFKLDGRMSIRKNAYFYQNKGSYFFSSKTENNLQIDQNAQINHHPFWQIAMKDFNPIDGPEKSFNTDSIASSINIFSAHSKAAIRSKSTIGISISLQATLSRDFPIEIKNDKFSYAKNQILLLQENAQEMMVFNNCGQCKVSGGNTSGIITQGGDEYKNFDFYVDGDFKINKNVKFTNCNFYFSPKGKIVKDAKFKSEFKGCNVK
jgi:hypothetical protein